MATTRNTKPAPPATAEVEARNPDPIMAALLGQGRVSLAESQDPDEVARKMLGRIAEAATEDDVFADTTTPIEDILGADVQLLEVDWRDSDYDEGPGVYAVLRIARLSGELVTVTTGAADVMAKCRKLQLLGSLPVWVKFTQSRKQTAAGYYPVNMLRGTAPGSF